MRQTLVLLTFAALGLAACDGFQPLNTTRLDPKTGQPAAEAATLLKAFPDIPVPANHKVDLERSMIFTSPSQTVGKLTTEGPGDVDTIYRFYQKEMQTQGWNLVNAFQSATSSMYFAKPGRFVAVIIEADGRNASRVTLNVGPE
jgi:hypothetical protein